MNQLFGEVVEGSLSNWKVCSWKWDEMPSFGSLLVIEQENIKIFGIVSHINTGSIDAERYPIPYKKTEEELKREQPQIFSLLQTIVSCVTLGYSINNNLFYQLPPYPPKIHIFVREASREELEKFFADSSYVHMLCSASSLIFSIDELLLTIFKKLIDEKLLSDENMSEAVNIFSTFSGGDYKKLKSFLQRIEKLQNISGQVQNERS